MALATQLPVCRRAAPPRIAFAALLIGNVVLAFGPWFVRHGRCRAGRLGLLAAGAGGPLPAPDRAGGSGQRFGRIAPWLCGWRVLAGGFFALDLGCWHIGILHTKLANATLFGNVGELLLRRAMASSSRARCRDAWQALAIALAAVGTALLLGRSYQLSRDRLAGDLLCLAAGLTYTGYMIAIERARATARHLADAGDRDRRRRRGRCCPSRC